MATDPYLIRKWIQFLKSNRIVALKSDPETGDLKYNRKPTSDDLVKFLEVATDHTPDEIMNAIHKVLVSKKTGTKPAKPDQTNKNPLTISTQQQTQQEPDKNSGQGKRIDPRNDDITDVEVKDISDRRQIGASPSSTTPPTPTEPARKPRFKYRHKNVNEDFADNPGYELDEDDVEQVFNILGKARKGQTEKTPTSARAPKEPAKTSSEDTEEKLERIRKIKRLIRDTMTDGQRHALWRELTDA